jgi:hypothetical protein
MDRRRTVNAGRPGRLVSPMGWPAPAASAHVLVRSSPMHRSRFPSSVRSSALSREISPIGAVFHVFVAGRSPSRRAQGETRGVPDS